ncbi:MAG: EscU/YscU/HrcU family type III secretion system export apparatus switch protein [Anaeromyxobacter sp.]
MDEEVDQEQKTEPASGQRLGRAWEEGSIPMGHDIVVVAGLACGLLALFVLAGTLRGGLSALMTSVAGQVDRMPFGDLPQLVVRPVAAAVGICAAAAFGTVLASIVQTKGGFWGERVFPDLSRVFNLPSFGRMLKAEFLLDIGLAAAKVALVAWVAWGAVRRNAPELETLLRTDLSDQLSAIVRLLVAVARPVLLVAVVLAIGELALSRWRYAKKMRMTKEEAKREFREDEGDPLIKGKRKKKHREFIRNLARKEVPRADALVVNPTHIAIAIRYRKDEARAPRVTCKGKGQAAEYMRELARENGIPIVEDIPLARLLYRKVKVGREIPAQTYKAVAAVLAFVYRVTGRRPGAGVSA